MYSVNPEIIVKNEVSIDPSEVSDPCQEVIVGNEENPYECVAAPVVQCLTSTVDEELCAFDEVKSGPPKKRMRQDDEVIDEDKSFLLSLLPEMRKLNGRQKIDFKISVLNNLKEARYSENSVEIKEEILG